MRVVLVVLAAGDTQRPPTDRGPRVSALHATCAWPGRLLCVAWPCVRESAIASTIRAVSVLVCLTKCVLAPHLHRAPVCVCTVSVYENVQALSRYRLPISKRQAGA